jgi:hypothetical protein
MLTVLIFIRYFLLLYEVLMLINSDKHIIEINESKYSLK